MSEAVGELGRYYKGDLPPRLKEWLEENDVASSSPLSEKDREAIRRLLAGEDKKRHTQMEEKNLSLRGRILGGDKLAEEEMYRVNQGMVYYFARMPRFAANIPEGGDGWELIRYGLRTAIKDVAEWNPAEGSFCHICQA